MRLNRFAIRRLVLMLSLAWGVTGLEGCKADGGSVDKSAKRAARRQKKGQEKKAANQAKIISRGFSGGGGGVGSMAAIDFQPASGYVVSGSDFLTFWPCNSDKYYYMVSPGPLNARIMQEYKFSATRPYLAMYVDVKVHFVEDSISRGNRVFERYAQMAAFVRKPSEERKCSPPGRERLSNELQRLDDFKPALYTR